LIDDAMSSVGLAVVVAVAGERYGGMECFWLSSIDVDGIVRTRHSIHP
jgi:hypothetical protein